MRVEDPPMIETETEQTTPIVISNATKLHILST